MPLYYSEPDHVVFQQEFEQITHHHRYHHHHHHHHRHHRSGCYPNHSDEVCNILLNYFFFETSLNHNQVRRLFWHLSQLRFVFILIVTKKASKIIKAIYCYNHGLGMALSSTFVRQPLTYWKRNPKQNVQKKRSGGYQQRIVIKEDDKIGNRESRWNLFPGCANNESLLRS